MLLLERKIGELIFIRKGGCLSSLKVTKVIDNYSVKIEYVKGEKIDTHCIVYKKKVSVERGVVIMLIKATPTYIIIGFEADKSINIWREEAVTK